MKDSRNVLAIQKGKQKKNSLGYFFKTFLNNPKNVGALAPSSPFLAKQMLRDSNIQEAEMIVELGPGTGSFTKQIVNQKTPTSEFFAVEIDKNFVERLNEDYPHVAIYHDSGTNAGSYLEKYGKAHADLIVSSIPWANLPMSLQTELLNEILSVLKPGGKLVSFAYIHSFYFSSAKAFRNRLQKEFSSFSISPIVWGNFPPAVVYTCSK